MMIPWTKFWRIGLKRRNCKANIIDCTLFVSAELCLVTHLCLTLCNPIDYIQPSSSVHGEFSRKEYWSGLPCPPPGDLPTQGLNPGLSHCRRILYCLNHEGSPRILKWIAYPFSRGASRPRNRTGVSCNPGRCFTSWAPREAYYRSDSVVNASV